MNLKALLKITPVEEQVKEKVLANFDKLTADQRFKIEEICWKLLSQLDDLKYSKLAENLLLEIEQGRKPYNANDFEEAKAKLFFDFKRKKEEAENEIELEDVRKNLQTQMRNPPVPIQKP